MILLELFLSFFKIGMFTIGGGYAMLALIQQEIVRYGWLTVEEFIDIVAIAEMTPGPIAVNAATFVGFRSAGVVGSITATTAVVLPSLIGILLISKVWERYKDSTAVKSVFAGVRPVIAGLIASVAITLGSTALAAITPGTFNLLGLLIAVGVFGAVHFLKVDPIKTLVVCAVLGMIFFR